MLKYYQVFISSASKGFESIRNRIINDLIKQNKYFPIAMEFMTADDSTFNMLWSYMQSSDVCLLFLGDRIGSKISRAKEFITDTDMIDALNDYAESNNIEDLGEITYTEFEFIAAKKLGIKILPFIKKATVEHCEKNNVSTELLRFYNSIRECSKFDLWIDEPDSSQVSNALNRFIMTNPKLPGWIREKDSEIYKSAEMAGITDIGVVCSSEKLRVWLKNANVLKLFLTTGMTFFLINNEILVDFLSRGNDIKLICCKPHSEALTEVQKLEEYVYGDRKKIHSEFEQVISCCNNIYAAAQLRNGNGKSGEIQVCFTSTLIRSSITIAENENDNSGFGWLTVTLPPAKSRETISFEMKSGDINNNSNNLYSRSLTHFNLTWKHSSEKNGIITIPYNINNSTISPIRQYWINKENIAVHNMGRRKRNKRILIEVAAQHPLIDGITPNEEFKARLDRASQLYYFLKSQKYSVEIYIPGNIHMDFNALADDISLSAAGKEYLVKERQFRNPEDIHGDDLNNAFDDTRTFSGVYNSADECYIASRYFFSSDKNFKCIYCICSPNQLMRKYIFYIENGIVPYIITVPTDEMFHNFFDELFEAVPYVIKEDHSLQSSESELAYKTRKERCPDFLDKKSSIENK